MKLLFSCDLHGLDTAYLEFAAELKRKDYSLGVLGGDLMTFPSRSEIAEARIEFQIKAGNHVDRKRPWHGPRPPLTVLPTAGTARRSP